MLRSSGSGPGPPGSRTTSDGSRRSRRSPPTLLVAPDVVPALPADEPRRRLLPFYEAYFSNYIEGTEFTLDEAASIFDVVIPADRPADAHDVLGTYEVVSDHDEMVRIPRSPDEFEELLRSRHARLMSAPRHAGDEQREGEPGGSTSSSLPSSSPGPCGAASTRHGVLLTSNRSRAST